MRDLEAWSWTLQNSDFGVAGLVDSSKITYPASLDPPQKMVISLQYF